MTVIPIVNGALGTITKDLVKGLDGLEIKGQVETIQTTSFFKIGPNTEKITGDLKSLRLQGKTIS